MTTNETDNREFRARMADFRTAERERIAQERTISAEPRFGDDILPAEQAAIERLTNL